MSLNAFGPRSLTYSIPVTDSASTPLQITSDPLCDVYQFVNAGIAVAYMNAASTAIPAVIPTIGTPANGVPILPNEIVLYRYSPGAYVSAVCKTGQRTTLLVSVGEGM